MAKIKTKSLGSFLTPHRRTKVNMNIFYSNYSCHYHIIIIIIIIIYKAIYSRNKSRSKALSRVDIYWVLLWGFPSPRQKPYQANEATTPGFEKLEYTLS